MNEVVTELDQLIGNLGKLGWFKTVRDANGREDVSLQRDIDRLLETYPFLEHSSEYVEFLRRYGGALLVRDDDGFLLSFFGFSHDIGIHITKGPGDPVEDDCLIFCDMSVPTGKARETCAVAYGFAATPELRWGIYKFVNGIDRSWCCETFFEWLRIVIKTRGRLFDPPVA
jgi:hypothetical protein